MENENVYTAESRFIGFNQSKGNVYRVRKNTKVNAWLVKSIDVTSTECRQLKLKYGKGTLCYYLLRDSVNTTFLNKDAELEEVNGFIPNQPSFTPSKFVMVWIADNKIALINRGMLDIVASPTNSSSPKNFSNFMSGSENATMKNNLVYLGSAALGGYLYMTKIKVLSNSTYNTLLGVGVGLGLGYVLNKYVIK